MRTASSASTFAPKRVAIYARYSSDLQRPSSVSDQIRQCREAATRKGWVVVDKYIRADEALSGRSRVGRVGLDELMTLAQDKSRPFDGIVIDDTSRFGRNLSDTLPMSDTLNCFDVFLHFANRDLDSTNPSFRTLFIAYGQIDEQYSRMLGEKVHRGQRGRVINGFSASGRTYGYDNVPVEHPYKKGLYGRPYVEAVRLVVNPEEAHTILRIFNLYAQGLGSRVIAKTLNDKSVPSPLRGSSITLRRWTTSAIKLILKNEKYRGVHVWNRTRTVYRPGRQGKVQQPRPETEWERVEVPEWRIVSEELWGTVRLETERRTEILRRSTGGLNRTKSSRTYIFSGMLSCGVCGGRMNVVGMKNGNVRYGCIAYRFSGTCDNKMTIRRDLLEDKLLGALATNLSMGSAQRYLKEEFVRQAAAAWKARARASASSSDRTDLRGKRDLLRQQSEHILNAIAEGAGSALVYDRLKLIESQLKTANELLTTQPASDGQVPDKLTLAMYLRDSMLRLKDVLLEAPEPAKLHMAKHLKRLSLIPHEQQQERFYEIRGENAGIFAPPQPAPTSLKTIRLTRKRSLGRRKVAA